MALILPGFCFRRWSEKLGRVNFRRVVQQRPPLCIGTRAGRFDTVREFVRASIGQHEGVDRLQVTPMNLATD